MPIIKVSLLSGRTDEQKLAFAREITRAFVETCGSDPKGVQVMFNDVDPRNWCVGGEWSSAISDASKRERLKG